MLNLGRWPQHILRILSLLLIPLLLLSPTPAAAGAGVQVVVDGIPVSYDVPPQIVSGRVLVPLRKTFEALGATVSWDPQQQTITAVRGNTRIDMTIGISVLKRNWQDIKLDVPPLIRDNRTLVPLRAVAEGLDAEVDWQGTTQTVSITSVPELPTTALTSAPSGGQVHFFPPYAVADHTLYRDGNPVGVLPDGKWLLAVSPENSDHLWAFRDASEESVDPLPNHAFESRDGGKNWTRLNDVSPLRVVTAVNDHVLVGSPNGYLQRSEDSGHTWQAIPKTIGPEALAAGPGGLVWAATNQGLFKSTDLGLTWTWSSLGMPSFYVRAISPSPTDPDQAVALTDGGIACTANGGAHWYPCGKGLPPTTVNAISHLARSPNGTLFISIDGQGVYMLANQRWRALAMPLPDGVQDLAAPADDRVAVSQYKQTTYWQIASPLPESHFPSASERAGGPHWSAPAFNGMATWGLYVNTVDPRVAVAFANNKEAALTQDGGKTWNSLGTLPDQPPYTLTGIPEGRYEPAFTLLPLRSADGGKTWRLVVSQDELGDNDQLAISANPANADEMLVTFNTSHLNGQRGILRSTDGGASWSHVWTSAPGHPEQGAYWLARSPQNPNLVYASGTINLVSHDGGATWKESGKGTVQGVDSQGALYGEYGQRGDQVPAISTNGGATWTPIPLPNGIQANLALIRPGGQPGAIFLFSEREAGLWYTKNGGRDWECLAADVGNSQVDEIVPAGDGGWYVRVVNGPLFRLDP